MRRSPIRQSPATCFHPGTRGRRIPCPAASLLVAIAALGSSTLAGAEENWAHGFASPTFASAHGGLAMYPDFDQGFFMLTGCIDLPAPGGAFVESMVLHWKTDHWEAVPSACDVDPGDVLDAAVAGLGSRYLVGTSLGTLEILDEGQWVDLLPTGPNGQVQAIAVDALGKVFVGGSFTSLDGTGANHVAYVDGTLVQALQDNGGVTQGTNSTVTDLGISGQGVAAAGFFTMAGSASAARVAEWQRVGLGGDGAWVPLGSGVPGTNPPRLFGARPDLWVVHAGSNNVRYLDETLQTPDWAQAGNPPVGSFFAHDLAVTGGGRVFAAGDFRAFGDPDTARLAEWRADISSWIGVSHVADAWDPQSAVPGELLHNEGDLFLRSDHDPLADPRSVFHRGLARFDGVHWHGLGDGIGDANDPHASFVDAIQAHDGALFVGGRFLNAGDRAAAGVVRRSGSQWSTPGDGLQCAGGYPVVRDFAVHQGQLYAGGRFLASGGTGLENVARWNGSDWVDVAGGIATAGTCGGGAAAGGGGLTGFGVTDLHAWNGRLYAAGSFDDGVATIDTLFEMEGGGWNPVPGAPSGGGALALADFGGRLYVAGRLGVAGHIRAWDGTSWHAVGGGVSGAALDTHVNAMVVVGSHLYVGGRFTHAGGVPAQNLARWNGSTWQAVGGGISGEVHELGVAGGQLVVGGAFEQASGTAIRSLARWDGSAWHAYEGGVLSAGPPTVAPVGAFAIHASTQGLWVGGNFDFAGTRPSSNIARWGRVVFFADGFESAIP